jgi:hypothetical protein
LADLATGSITNQVSVTGNNLAGEKITRISNVLSMGSNKLEKIILTQIPMESFFDAAGDQIHFVLTLKNNGDISLSNVSISIENGKNHRQSDDFKPGAFRECNFHGSIQNNTV